MIRRSLNIRQTCYPRLSNPKRIAEFRKSQGERTDGRDDYTEPGAGGEALDGRRGGMERASLSPAEYVAYRMKVSAADAEALVAAVYALEEEE